MIRNLALLSAAMFWLTLISAVKAGVILDIDACDGSELRRSRGVSAKVMGRVVSSGMEDGQLMLVLDGEHLAILVGTAPPDDWTGRLIEVLGSVEDRTDGRPWEPELKIFLRTTDTIRVIKEDPDREPSKLTVREKPQNLDSWYHRPPGKAPSAEQLAASPSFRNPQSWVRLDGTKGTASFNNWKWRQRLGDDFESPEWVVSMLYAPDESTRRWFYPEDLQLTAAEEERLRIMLWKEYQSIKERSQTPGPVPPPPVAGDALAATETWVERIVHWGESPLQEDPKAQRLPGMGDFGNLPDLRKLTEVKLRRASPLGRKEGKLVLLDWAMTAEPRAEDVPANIRWEDGEEETVPALDVFPNIFFQSARGGGGNIGQAEAALIYMKDWVRARQARETLPEAEMKIRAVRQFLKCWWDSRAMALPLKLEQEQKKQEEARKAQAEAAAKAKASTGWAALDRLHRHGYTLEFPGLPPVGFMELPPVAVDRTLLKPVAQEIGKLKMDDTVANMTAAFLWWDAAGVLPIPEKLGKRRREAMLQNQVERYLKGGVDSDRHKDFGEKALDGRYCLQLTEDMDFSPANLARYVAGHHTVLLNLSVWDSREYRFPVSVLVHSASTDGNLVFSWWGEVGTAHLKVVTLNRKGKRPAGLSAKLRECYELELTGSAALVNYLNQKGFRLILDDWQHNSIQVITPWAMNPAVPPVKQ